MFKLYIWLRTYKYELIATIVDIALVILASLNKDVTIIAGSLVLIILSFFVVLFFHSKDRDFYYLPLDKPGEEVEWIGRGDLKFHRTEGCYEITNSNVGYLYPKTLLWDDYVFEFDFKIIKNTCGWIVRAQNLSNYVMLQCTDKGINPHIRLDGQWIVYKHDKENLTFNEQLSFDKWYKAKITSDKRMIKMCLTIGKEPVFNRQWIIPDKLIWQVNKENEKEKFNLLREIDFDFGGIGFRNYPGERAFVKNVYINKL